jgi:membrane associated rhomboid family serine protease
VLVVHRDRDKAQIDAAALVLSSAGIPYRLEYGGTEWVLIVENYWYGLALDALNAYYEEARQIEAERSRLSSPTQRSLSGIWVALALLALQLFLTVSRQLAFAVGRFAFSATAVLDGELFRCVTSLFLHADTLHVVGNAVGMALFGTAVARGMGYGVGWLLVLLSGAIGNFANAVMRGGHHLSIGASTAVFGALGVLVTTQLVRKRPVTSRFRTVIVPVGGGLALLAIMGTGGQRTDLLAHLLGFCAGTVVSVPFALANPAELSTAWQRLCLVLLVAVITLAWLEVLRI